MTLRALLSLASALSLALLPTIAIAAPDQSGSVDIAEPLGFPGVCDQPCFTARKTFELYLDGNATVPAGANCPAGDNTYIYKIEHLGGSGPFVPALTQFELSAEADDITSAGFIAGFGINPSSTAVDGGSDVVRWDFQSPSIADSAMSTKLFVCSALLPGTVTDTMVSVDAQFSLDAAGTCVGPLFEPAGEPLPCTIGFWKNRSLGKKGTLKHFPDPEFDQVVDGAVALSGGIFADSSALLGDLQSKGNRPMDQRARQQFAAYLLNLSAGDLFPDNSKCKLFDGNQIDSNSCGSNISVSDGTAFFFANYGAGDYEAAKDCADDTNNGIGVVGVNSGE